MKIIYPKDILSTKIFNDETRHKKIKSQNRNDCNSNGLRLLAKINLKESITLTMKFTWYIEIKEIKWQTWASFFDHLPTPA